MMLRQPGKYICGCSDGRQRWLDCGQCAERAAYEGGHMVGLRGRVMVVGEQPPRRWSQDERYRMCHSPLFFLPANSAGARLYEMSGLTRREYMFGVDRVNLIPEWTERWDRDRARQRAVDLVRCGKPSTVFALGRRVATAFGCDDPMPHKFSSGVLECDVVCIPHPSGRCRAYNDPAVRAWVRSEFDELQPSISEWAERRRALLCPSDE